MYICIECGAHFERPGGYWEAHGEWFNVCPFCHDTGFAEAHRCRCCGQLKPDEDLSDGLCSTCIGIWRSVFHASMQRFTAEERFFISVAMDGQAIEYDDPLAV